MNPSNLSQDARDYWAEVWAILNSGEEITVGEMHARLEEKYGRGAREEIEEMILGYREELITAEMERLERYDNNEP